MRGTNAHTQGGMLISIDAHIAISRILPLGFSLDMSGRKKLSFFQNLKFFLKRSR
jgi:hypothetical protein